MYNQQTPDGITARPCVALTPPAATDRRSEPATLRTFYVPLLLVVVRVLKRHGYFCGVHQVEFIHRRGRKHHPRRAVFFDSGHTRHVQFCAIPKHNRCLGAGNNRSNRRTGVHERGVHKLPRIIGADNHRSVVFIVEQGETERAVLVDTKHYFIAGLYGAGNVEFPIRYGVAGLGSAGNAQRLGRRVHDRASAEHVLLRAFEREYFPRQGVVLPFRVWRWLLLKQNNTCIADTVGAVDKGQLDVVHRESRIML